MQKNTESFSLRNIFIQTAVGKPARACIFSDMSLHVWNAYKGVEANSGALCHANCDNFISFDAMLQFLLFVIHCK
jgi:hypothetical protein